MREDLKSQTVILDVIKNGQKAPLGIKGNSWDAQKLLLFVSFLRGSVSLKTEQDKNPPKKKKRTEKSTIERKFI